MSEQDLNSIAEEAATAAEEGGTATPDSTPGTDDGSGGQSGDQKPSLVDQLKAAVNAGEVSTADLQWLDRHFQSSFNKRVDRLEKNISTSVADAAAKRGITLPEGKSVMDLMTEDNGKPFAEFMKSLVESSNAPIRERLDKAEEDEQLRLGMAQAQQQWPEVRKNFPKILEVIDSSELLTKVAKKDRGEALPLIMLGVAKDIELQNERAKNLKMTEILKKAGLAAKVGESTTKAKSAVQPPRQEEKPKTLRGIAEAAANSMPDFGSTN